MLRRFVVLSLLLSLPSLADEGSGMPEVLAKVAPGIATVKVVTQTDVTMGGQSQSSESRTEVQGVVVDETGLVMISNATFDTSGMKDLLSAGGGGGADLKVTPTEFKVVIEQEEKEYEAFLAATDTKLGLAFVQIVELGDRKLASVGFDGAAELAVGQRLLAVGRLKKGYDYAPYVVQAKVTGKIAKPRAAWLVDGDMAGAGLPVFTADGQVAGVIGDVQVTSDEEGGDGNSRLLRRLLGRMNRAEPAAPSFLLPPGPVKASIEAAKKQAAELAIERATKKEEAPKDDKESPKDGEEEAPKDGEEPKDGEDEEPK
ncbi:MAG: trypsin-like peptidase domain-containing protein [Planctomycetota bacterium]